MFLNKQIQIKVPFHAQENTCGPSCSIVVYSIAFCEKAEHLIFATVYEGVSEYMQREGDKRHERTRSPANKCTNALFLSLVVTAHCASVLEV